MSDSPNKAEMTAAIASVVEVVLLVVGGLLGYLFISRPLTEAQVTLARLQENRESASIMDMETSHVVRGHEYEELRLLEISFRFENIGLVPITIGTVESKAFEGQPTLQIQNMLQHGRVGVTIVREQRIRLNEETGEEEVYTEDVPVLREPSDEELGDLIAISHGRVSWDPRPALDETVQKSVTLQPGEGHQFLFHYLFGRSRSPRWYKFDMTISPPAIDEEKWKPKNVTHVVHLGPFPGHEEIFRGAPAEAIPNPPPPAPDAADTGQRLRHVISTDIIRAAGLRM